MSGVQRDRRNIDIAMRFRNPEYWPWTEGLVTSEAAANNEDIFDDFAVPNAFVEHPITPTLLYESNFDDSSQDSVWTTYGDATNNDIISDPTGAGRGRVKRVTNSTTSNGGFYADTSPGGVDLRGIRSGKIVMDVFKESGSSLHPAIIVRTTETPPSSGFPTGDHYFIEMGAPSASSSDWEITKRISAVNTKFLDNDENMSFGTNGWVTVEFEWMEKQYTNYGYVFFARARNVTSDIYAVNNVNVDSITPYGYDEIGGSPILDNATGRILFHVTDTFAGSGSVYIDNIKIYKYTQGLFVE